MADRKKLTDAYVATLTCPRDKARFCVTDVGGGLMVTVEQNGNKRWRWRRGSQMSAITIGDPDRVTYQAAGEASARLEQALRDGIDPRSVALFPERDIKVTDVLDHHIAKVTTPTNAETIRTMTSAYKPVKARFGSMAAIELRRKHLIEFFEDGYEDRQGAARSLARYLTAAFTIASKEKAGLLTSLPHGNPATGILRDVAFQRKSKPTSYAQALERDEISQILSAIAALKAEQRHDWLGLTIIELALFTGARPSEIQSLRWDELSHKDGLTVIEKTRHKTSHATDRPRIIVAGSIGESVFRSIRQHHESKSLSSEWLFPRSKKYIKARASHITTSYHLAKIVSSRSGVNFTAYNLRSIYINHSLDVLGLDYMRCVSENVGHASITTTQRHYVATRKSDRKFSVSAVSDAFTELS